MKNLWAPWRLEYVRRVDELDCFFCHALESAEDHDEKNLLLVRGARSLVMMNKYPYNNGHLLIAPNQHVSELRELEPDTLHELFDRVVTANEVLRRVLDPHGFNVGVNLGRVAGAGLDEHLHVHIVPRWNGDTNFMPVFGEVRVIPQALCELFRLLRDEYDSVGARDGR